MWYCEGAIYKLGIFYWIGTWKEFGESILKLSRKRVGPYEEREGVPLKKNNLKILFRHFIFRENNRTFIIKLVYFYHRNRDYNIIQRNLFFTEQKKVKKGLSTPAKNNKDCFSRFEDSGTRTICFHTRLKKSSTQQICHNVVISKDSSNANTKLFQTFITQMV